MYFVGGLNMENNLQEEIIPFETSKRIKVKFKRPTRMQFEFIEDDDIPSACISCSNHKSNGGSGICHCILGSPQITC